MCSSVPGPVAVDFACREEMTRLEVRNVQLLLDDLLRNKLVAAEDAFHFGIALGHGHQNGTVDVVDEEAHEEEHEQEVHQANPLYLDHVRDPAYEKLQRRRTADGGKQHQTGDALRGDHEIDNDVGEAGQGIVPDLL